MLKYLLIALLFVGATPPLAAAQKTKSVRRPELTTMMIVDRNGFTETVTSKERLEQYARVNFLTPQPYQKVLRVFTRDPKGNIFSLMTTYHTNGQVKQYLEIKNGQAHGLYQEWYPSGQLKLHTHVIGGQADLEEFSQAGWLFDGQSAAYDEAGNLTAEIHYCKGVIHGESVYYHPNGKVAARIPYSNGQVDGDYSIYSAQEELLQKTPFSEGVPHGHSVSYWPGGALAAKEEFQKGLLINGVYTNAEGEELCRVTDGDGKRTALSGSSLREIQEVREGVQAGAVSQYTKEGKLEAVYHIKENGSKHGDEYLYYPNEKPKMLIQWYDGAIQGTSKSWYLNGAQESAREMSKNKKQGSSFAWYPSGDLMLVEEYDEDKLLKGRYFKKGEREPASSVIDGNGEVTLYDKEGTLSQKIRYERGRPVIDK